MTKRSWIRNVFARPVTRPVRKGLARRLPTVEALEDRILLTFNHAVPYPSGADPQAVAVGEFNGDGKQDLVVVNYLNGNVRVFLGDSNGTYAPGGFFATNGVNPSSVAVADFNGDGKQDLAVTNFGSDNVSVLRGNGDGTFLAPLLFGTGDGPRSVAVADFNGDGKADLAVANANSHTVSALLGNGTGAFGPATHSATGFAPRSVAVGDFNRDGRPDLITANTFANTVSVLPGNGNGTFAGAIHHQVGSQPVSVVVGDFNGDGRLDLATANLAADTVTVRIGTPVSDFAFGGAVHYAAGDGPSSLAVADVNRDGKPDLTIANALGDSVSVLLGAVDASFGSPVSYAAGDGPSSVATGDFNGDGKVDLAVANADSNDISVLLNNLETNSSFLFDPPVHFDATTQMGSQSVVVGDFNRDGKPDLAMTDVNGTRINVLFNTGNGAYGTPLRIATPLHAHALAVGDLNNDGKLDLAITQNDLAIGLDSYVSVLLGNGDGTFQSIQNYNVGGKLGTVAVGDFNGDGRPDLAVAHVAHHQVSVWLGNGNGSFQTPVIHTVELHPTSVAVGDFNGDGRQDLAVAAGHSTHVGVLFGAGNGTFQPAAYYGIGGSPLGQQPLFVAVADFDDDGNEDLVTANFQGHVSVLSGNGNGTFQPSREYTAVSLVDSGGGNLFRPAVLSVAVGDFNGDGKLDLATANESIVNSVSVLPGNGDGTFQPFLPFAVPSHARAVAVGDFNRDGLTDLAAAFHGVSVMLVAPNTAPTIVSDQAAVTANEGSAATNTGTFDDTHGRDTVTLTASLGTLTRNDSAGTWSWLHTPPDGPDGPTMVTVTATDALGLSASTTFTLTVNNVAPGIAISGAMNTNEGAVYTLTLGAVTDPGQDTVTQYVIHWGDGSSDTYTSAGAKTHTYADGPAVRVITVDLVDEDGTHTNRANPRTVTVANVAPTITSFTVPAATIQGSPVGLSATATDPAGAFDPLTYTWTVTRPDSGTFTVTGASATFTPADIGSYAVRLTVSDDDGGSVSQTSTLTVYTQLAAAKFVQALYQYELGRTASATEVAAQLGTFAGSGGQAAVAAGIVDSTEARVRQVASWFQTYLGRAPSASEISFWADLLSGQTEEQLQSQILGSIEFFDRAQNMGFGGTPDENYVGALYQVLLGRAASSAEVDAQVNALPSLGLQGVAMSLLQSVEYRANVVQGYYTTLLGRTGSPAEIASHVNSSSDLRAIRVSFESSVEFISISASKTPTITSLTIPNTTNVGSPVVLNSAADNAAGNFYPLSYSWTITRPDSSTFTLTGDTATFTPSHFGSYGVRISVSDHDGGITSIPATGMVSLWLGEGSANDALGGNHGTLVGGVSYAQGKVGQAFHLDGTGRVQVNDAANLSLTIAATLEAWIYPSALTFSGGFGQIIGKGSGEDRNYGLFVTSTGALHLSYFTTGGATVDLQSADHLVPVGQFSHVAAVIDPAAGAMQIYLNGQRVGSRATAGPLVANTSPLTIGSTLSGGFGFTGLIDEPSVYGRGLSQIEIQSVVNAGSVGKLPSIAVHSLTDGDFNDDGQWDCADIDALTVEIASATNNPAFDLTGDQLVNLLDRDAWLLEAGGINIGPGRAYRLGDANLDGVVDGSDFNIWNSNKFAQVAAWCLADFNADGFVDGSDFNVWNSNKFTVSDSGQRPWNWNASPDGNSDAADRLPTPITLKVSEGSLAGTGINRRNRPYLDRNGGGTMIIKALCRFENTREEILR